MITISLWIVCLFQKGCENVTYIKHVNMFLWKEHFHMSILYGAAKERPRKDLSYDYHFSTEEIVGLKHNASLDHELGLQK